ncbi:MAG: GatB/YqeY domain-containing protein [Gammaproteobacteria bacterium]|nr:GatB/YqeY domain-containing protein [Gammaproteobacteria bacterium]MCB1925355.1 GatB/YqeY domain-containing protein [Gammaproteobacteria bacterium]
MVLKQQITDAMKAAMKGGDKPRLGVIRLMLAAIKQREVDERIELDDAQVLAVLDKMVKQRRDSIQQYEDAGRDELAAAEAAEITVIQDFLPEELSDAEIGAIIDAAISDSGAESMRDMGKVMAIVKPKVQGRADVGKVSGLVKQKLG